MKALRSLSHAAAACAFAVSTIELTAASAQAAATATAKRTTLAITYPEGLSTKIAMTGVAGQRGTLGSADVKRKDGRTRVKLDLSKLPHPQSLGSLYTTYLLWAVAPEGQAERLAELPHSKDFGVDVTTSFQTFGLIVSAEPHSAVPLPSPMVMAENTARGDTKGLLRTSRVDYGGAVSDLYAAGAAPSRVRQDRNTPLLVLAARNSVDLARNAEAARYASGELRDAEAKLAALEEIWPRHKKLPKLYEDMARDVMRVAEHARVVAVERGEQARLADEREAASARLTRAQTEAERARLEAERAQLRAEMEGKQAAVARSDALLERERASLARDETARARANEEAARSEAERARLNEEAARREADQARQDREATLRQLQVSLNAILETRREARGLIVNLSDVLFDFNRASLTPGAREKLSKLSGVLIAYPGNYRISTEGHTDSVGTDEYNQRLSTERAQSALTYLLQAGIPAARTSTASGFGESRPVASNDSAAGRQMNRRVEIVISGLEND